MPVVVDRLREVRAARRRLSVAGTTFLRVRGFLPSTIERKPKCVSRRTTRSTSATRTCTTSTATAPLASRFRIVIDAPALAATRCASSAATSSRQSGALDLLARSDLAGQEEVEIISIGWAGPLSTRTDVDGSTPLDDNGDERDSIEVEQ